METIASTWQNLALYTAAVATAGYALGCWKQFLMDRAIVRASNNCVQRR